MKGFGLLRRLKAIPPWVYDAILAAVLLAVVLAMISLLALHTPREPGTPWVNNVPMAVALSIVGVIPILIRRWVWIAAVLVAVVAVIAVPLVGTNTTEGYSVLVVIYTAAVLLPPLRAAGATAIVAAGICLACVEAQANIVIWMANGVFTVIPFAIGSVVRTRRAYVASLEQRAVEAETTRELTARDAVLAERQRIARELHDVVAHHISVMSVMAAAARRTLRTKPDVADEALGTIEETGRSTLREMRRLLDVLRDDKDSSLPTTPQPGLPGLQALVHQVGEAGLIVRLQVEGEPMPLDSGVDLTLFRIVQEALTNTLKHAGPTSADVVLRYGPSDVEVTVSDNGRGPAGTNIGGHGLVGMRERVGLYSGSLYTGPGPSGGFTVRATVPFDRPAHTKGIPA